MSSRRKTRKASHDVVSGAHVAPDAAAYDEVVFLTSCVVDGVRREAGEVATVARAQAKEIAQRAWAIEREAWEKMPDNVQWPWARARRHAIAPDALCATRAQIDALWNESGRVLTPDGSDSAYAPASPARDAIRVLNLTTYDPGSSVYRYHSATNTDARVISAFARFGHSNPHCDVRQWDGEMHRTSVELLAWSADVLHVHMDYRALFDELRYLLRPGQRLAITYHGSVEEGSGRTTLRDEDADRRNNTLLFGARPYHHRYGVPNWLPIPMPVQDYAALRASHRMTSTRFRVAHSPTRRAIKGTQAFLDACLYVTEHLGIAVEPVLIEDMPHGEALARKASCDAVFDSFWLGMQGSGLEGAAMGLPVIAGDPDAACDLTPYEDACPWTLAEDTYALREQLVRLATDAQYAATEAARVNAYVRRRHDYPVVGALYADALVSHCGGDRGAAHAV